MTLPELLQDESLRRAEFPVVRDRIFLAHAGVCPLPARVSRAMAGYAEEASLGDQERLFTPARLRRPRELAARLLGAEPDEIALVGPTSLALSFIASGLPLRRRDNILVYHDDYPSNVYPWMALAEKGVQVRFINVKELGRVRQIDVMGQVDEQTRLVALASCHFLAGFRIDIAGIGAYLRARNIWFCVDGIQTLGAFPTLVEHVDFLAADAHKWLLGPCAAGILYVRRKLQELLKPTVYGWHNVQCPGFVAQDSIQFSAGARRYEAGSENLIGTAGLTAAMELLLEIGIDAIAAELLRKRAWLVPALQAKGFTVLQGDAPAAHASGIVTFFKPEADMAALHRTLDEHGVSASLRTDRAGREYLRFSPHFYNTDEELSRAVSLL